MLSQADVVKYSAAGFYIIYRQSKLEFYMKKVSRREWKYEGVQENHEQYLSWSKGCLWLFLGERAAKHLYSNRASTHVIVRPRRHSSHSLVDRRRARRRKRRARRARCGGRRNCGAIQRRGRTRVVMVVAMMVAMMVTGRRSEDVRSWRQEGEDE